MKKKFCIGKFFYVINKFTNLETLTMQSIYDAPQVFKYLGTLKAGYSESLKNLSINACILKEESKDGGWVQD